MSLVVVSTIIGFAATALLELVTGNSGEEKEKESGTDEKSESNKDVVRTSDKTHCRTTASGKRGKVGKHKSRLKRGKRHAHRSSKSGQGGKSAAKVLASTDVASQAEAQETSGVRRQRADKKIDVQSPDRVDRGQCDELNAETSSSKDVKSEEEDGERSGRGVQAVDGESSKVSEEQSKKHSDETSSDKNVKSEEGIKSTSDQDIQAEGNKSDKGTQDEGEKPGTESSKDLQRPSSDTSVQNTGAGTSTQDGESDKSAGAGSGGVTQATGSQDQYLILGARPKERTRPVKGKKSKLSKDPGVQKGVAADTCQVEKDDKSSNGSVKTSSKDKEKLEEKKQPESAEKVIVQSPDKVDQGQGDKLNAETSSSKDVKSEEEGGKRSDQEVQAVDGESDKVSEEQCKKHSDETSSSKDVKSEEEGGKRSDQEVRVVDGESGKVSEEQCKKHSDETSSGKDVKSEEEGGKRSDQEVQAVDGESGKVGEEQGKKHSDETSSGKDVKSEEEDETRSDQEVQAVDGESDKVNEEQGKKHSDETSSGKDVKSGEESGKRSDQKAQAESNKSDKGTQDEDEKHGAESSKDLQRPSSDTSVQNTGAGTSTQDGESDKSAGAGSGGVAQAPGSQDQYLALGARPKKRTKPVRVEKSKPTEKSNVQGAMAASSVHVDQGEVLGDSSLLEGAKPKDRSTKGKGPKPPERPKKPAVQFFDWDSGSYSEKDPFLVQSEKEFKKDSAATQQEVGLTTSVTQVDAMPVEKKTGELAMLVQVTVVNGNPVITVPRGAFKLSLVNRDNMSQQLPYKKHRNFQDRMSQLKHMQFIYCYNMYKNMFCVEHGYLSFNQCMIQSLMISDAQYMDLLCFVMKNAYLLCCTQVFNNTALRNSLVWNGWFVSNPNEVDIIVFQSMHYMYSCSAHELKEYLSLLFNKYIALKPKIVHSPLYFKRLLLLLCNLVNRRLCVAGCSEQILDFAIVNTAVMLGCMYLNYRDFSDIPLDAGIDEIIAHMKLNNSRAGVIGGKCLLFFSNVNNLYSSSGNDLKSVKMCGMQFPRILVQQCSERFPVQLGNAIATGVVFEAIMKDLAMQLCVLVDKMSVEACEEEIDAYAEIYNRIINNFNVGEDKGQQR
ncbi:hypothetical protein [Ehrlichia minasensis]|uniref:hypothetical protein n=1 Tax=Ehrlichia minasensis TaxID=1242993 RepID=UPI00102259BA|nr:hypothetical protein [Ehrlichia minasensis]